MDIEQSTIKNPQKILHFTNGFKSQTITQEQTKKQISIICKAISQLILLTNSFHLNKTIQAVKILSLNQKNSQVKQQFENTAQKCYSQIIDKIRNTTTQSKLLKLNQYISSSRKNRIMLSTILHKICSKDKVAKKLNSILKTVILRYKNVWKQLHRDFIRTVTQFRNNGQYDKFQSILRNYREIQLFEESYPQFIQMSKMYYIGLSNNCPKDTSIFQWIDKHLKNQQALQNILAPQQRTVYFAQKQLIEQHYQNMLEKFQQLANNQYENSINLNLLWNFTKRLKNQQQLQKKLKQYILKSRNYIQNAQLDKVPKFQAHCKKLISRYFESQRRYLNLLYQTMDIIIGQQNQKYYRELLGQLFRKQKQGKSYLFTADFSIFQELFLIIPNKIQFLNKFQEEFIQEIINANLPLQVCQQSFNYNWAQQFKFIGMMKRQCGGKICDSLITMSENVWNGQKFNQITFQKVTGLVLSSSAWPNYVGTQIALPNELRQLQDHFQSEYKARQANQLDINLKWCSDFGIITLTIDGHYCYCSEIQASILIILEKSIRPMRNDQISQILQTKVQQITPVLQKLQKHKLIFKSKGSPFYEFVDKYQPEQLFKTEIIIGGKLLSTDRPEQIVRDYSVIIQGAIIRIMKNRKIMQKTDLSSTVLTLIRNFKPSLEQINEAIKTLAAKNQITIDSFKGFIKYVDQY